VCSTDLSTDRSVELRAGKHHRRDATHPFRRNPGITDHISFRSDGSVAGATSTPPPSSYYGGGFFVARRFLTGYGRGFQKEGVPPFQRGSMLPSRLRPKTEIRQGFFEFGLETTDAGRRGGILRREAWRARMVRSRSPTRPGMETVLQNSLTNMMHAASSACWSGMPSRCRASASSSILGPKSAARKSAGDADVSL